uniref:Uncharacterized protein n=1 Tax=Oryza rufipogon TaxID=4529 RepID=A0A0E0NT89_ORYRU
MLNVLIVPQSSPFHEKRGWARVFPNGVESLRRAVPSGSSDLPQKSSYAQSPSTARGRRMGANEGGAAWSARHGCRRPQSSPANRLRRGADTLTAVLLLPQTLWRHCTGSILVKKFCAGF